jgi:HK97 family phage major capsid protein
MFDIEKLKSGEMTPEAFLASISDHVLDEAGKKFVTLDIVKEFVRQQKTQLIPTPDRRQEKQIAWQWMKAKKNAKYEEANGLVVQNPHFFRNPLDYEEKQITTTEAAGAIPTPILNEIIRAVREADWLRQEVTVVPLGSMNLTVPVEGTGVTAERVAQLVGATKAAPTTAPCAFTAYTINAWTIASDELIETSGPDIVAFLSYLIGTGIAVLEFKEFAVGTGTNEAKGLNAYSITEKSCAGGLDYDKFIDLFTGIKAEDRAKAIWLCNDIVLAKLLKVKDTIGRPYVDPTVLTLFGKRILTNSNFTNTQLYFGNCNAYYWGDLRNYRLDITREGQTLRSTGGVYLGARVANDGRLTRTAAFIEGTEIPAE